MRIIGDTYRLGLVRDLHDHVGLSATIWDTETEIEGAMFRTSRIEVKRLSNICPGRRANVAESSGWTTKERAILTQ